MAEDSLEYYQDLIISIGVELSNLSSSLPTSSPISTASPSLRSRERRATTTLPFPCYDWECVTRDVESRKADSASLGTFGSTRLKLPLTPSDSRTDESTSSTRSLNQTEEIDRSIAIQNDLVDLRTDLSRKEELNEQETLRDQHTDVEASGFENDSSTPFTHLTDHTRNQLDEISPTSSGSNRNFQKCCRDLDADEIIRRLTDFELEREQKGLPLTDCTVIFTTSENGIKTLRISDLTDDQNPIRACFRVNKQKANVLEYAKSMAANELNRIIGNLKTTENSENDKFEFPFVRLARNVFRQTFRTNSTEKTNFGRSFMSTKIVSEYNSELPLFVHCMMKILLYVVENLNAEGLFRTATTLTQATECRDVCNSLSVNDPLPEVYCNESMMTVLADVFKKFFREVPNKLISPNISAALNKCMLIEDIDDRLHAMRCCVLLMDSCKRNVLFTLSAFLLRISKHQINTKMSLDSLITIFAPNICKFELLTSSKDDDCPIMNYKQLSRTLTFVIENIYQVMSIPTSFLEEAADLTLTNLANFTSLFADHMRYNTNLQTIQTFTGEREQVEFRAEATIEGNPVEILVALLDRTWNHTVFEYGESQIVDGCRTLIQCRTKRCASDDPPFLISRYIDYILLPDSKFPVYALFERIYPNDSDSEIGTLTYFLFPFTNNLYKTVVLLLTSIKTDVPQPFPYVAEDSLRILHALHSRVHSSQTYA
ncbi:hypothetical protein M3Y94_00296100 [Aphelenchoides besseyi]|nr:hypothetical protein M3Y94_00296100 [Aphelenchoides besseyi]KAI6235867.1 hypothetical protein M3Y95_00097000 [Aphelenchoides besseyi]